MVRSPLQGLAEAWIETSDIASEVRDSVVF